MKKLALIVFSLQSVIGISQLKPGHNLFFDSLATRWDEAMPMGNGWLGILIWKKGDNVRLSLDRVDLWDDRPMPGLEKLTFKWVTGQVHKKEYDTVQKLGDEPYEKNAAPTKIPGAALEFRLSSLGKVKRNELDIKTGLSTIEFQNGAIFRNYIHAVERVGYFGFENYGSADITPMLMIPNYNSGTGGNAGNSVEGQGLERLGYQHGIVTSTPGSIRYRQPTWNGNYYEVLVQWKKFPGNRVIGAWTISNGQPAVLKELITTAKEPTGWDTHIAWWKNFWSRSSVTLPDELLETQYYREMYKFACVTRRDTPPISLQAIWTADNGNLPPWKGDYHHDLNTQLSYWPGYSGNHLDLTASYTNWLWKVKEENKRWTKTYFQIDGLNVPGVTTISGKPMGGWIQYSMSPTTSAWLAQHFYWQWKFSMDSVFLKKYARPYITGVSSFLEEVTSDNDGIRNLALSSSPEYNNNSLHAWFKDWTNYDLALVKYVFDMMWSIDFFSNKESKAAYWSRINSQLPEFNHNETGLTIAPGQNLDESHRHHAQLMAIHPLGTLNPEKPLEKEIIDKSLRWLEKQGTRNWCGYSFSWAACIYARAKEADNAVKNLKIFATNFCSPNSFHLNGDQKKGQYSNFTYRPFTLEGNFAFAQGIHELLLNSHKNYIEIFPATPAAWTDVSFNTLRAEGAFLVSAKKVRGIITELKIKAEVGGNLRVKLPFKTWISEGTDRKYINIEKEIASVKMKKGQIITFSNINH